MPHQQDEFLRSVLRHWWAHWCIAAFLLIMAPASWWLFGQWEQSDQKVRGVVSLFFHSFGQLGLPIFFGVASMVFFGTGLWRLLTTMNDDTDDE